MAQKLTGGGWLGLPPTGHKIKMRSLDFWRREHGRIRKNRVLVDPLDIHRQLGVDMFDRMRSFNGARVPGLVPPLKGTA